PGSATQPFPAFGVYVKTPLHLEPTSLQQWNLSVQRVFGDWLTSASYLGNHSSHLWRATELNPAVYGAGATTGNTNTRRVLYLENPQQGQFYGTIGQLDDTGRANYEAALFSVQRRLKNNLSVLSNWTISKCMSDPATTEITGPTIVNPANPDLDYSYCSSDRRHVVNLSLVARTPNFDNRPLLHAICSDWQASPIIRWQSGNRTSVTTGVDNALTGLGGQRAVQVLDDPYGSGAPLQYLNRAAFASPASGTYSALAPFTIVYPSNLQNDFALTRTFRLGVAQNVQFRWEVFNVINHVNLGSVPAGTNTAEVVTAPNTEGSGWILTAGG